MLDEFQHATAVNQQPFQRSPKSDHPPAIKINQLKVKWPIVRTNTSKEEISWNQENVLSNVSFTLQPGEFMAITGPVGSGKVIRTFQP